MLISTRDARAFLAMGLLLLAAVGSAAGSVKDQIGHTRLAAAADRPGAMRASPLVVPRPPPSSPSDRGPPDRALEW